jgi:hypothetical protein
MSLEEVGRDPTYFFVLELVFALGKLCPCPVKILDYETEGANIDLWSPPKVACEGFASDTSQFRGLQRSIFAPSVS